MAQSLAGGNNTVILATGGIVGAMLAPDKSLATLPISIYVLGLWFGALPIGWLARRYGRRTAYQIGTVCGVLTGLICYVAVTQGSFLIFCVGTFVSGLYAAAHLSYRFAAADTASDAFRPKAISWVMIGGIVSGIIGPQVVIFTKDVLPPFLFAATFLAQAGLAAAVRRRADAAENSGAAAQAGRRRGTPARRDRAPAEIHCCGRMRCRQLFDDEYGDDRRAARHGDVQPFGR